MLFLAQKHLRQRPKQTLITTTGLFLGTASFVVVSAYTLGLEQFFKERLLDNAGHFRISSREDYIIPEKVRDALFASIPVRWLSAPSGRRDNARIEDPLGWYQRLGVDKRVEAFAPQLVSQALLSRGPSSASAAIYGVIPSRQVKVAPRIPLAIKQGSFLDLELGGNRIVIGEGLRQNLGVSLGDTLKVTVGKSGEIPFKVVGIFQLGLEELDKTTGYASLADVQKLTGKLSEVNEISVRLLDRDSAKRVAVEYRAFSRERVRSWDEINETFVAIIGIQTALRILVVGILSTVIAFGIFNVLNISVAQKKKDIAILRAMGFSRSQVAKLFLYQGAWMAVVGGGLGLSFGYLICLKLSTLEFSANTGKLSISFSWLIYLASFSVALGVSLLAAYLPARGAAKLLPIRIIREGAE